MFKSKASIAMQTYRSNSADECVCGRVFCTGDSVDTLSSRQRTLLGLLFPSQHALGGSGGMT